MPDFRLELAHPGLVAGIDEAGRGPWAGPVIAAAVVLDRDRLPMGLLNTIDDSKALSRARRKQIYAGLRALIGNGVHIGIGGASAAEIDRVNVLEATMLAMGRALRALDVLPDLALVDGNRAPKLPCAVKTVVGGDRLSLSIAAASIVAKVTRDGIMAELARRHPGFGWEHNAGYGTARHQEGLAAQGPTRHHRRSFAPIRRLLEPESH
ncbi:MAG: ribonuclease HII [Chloroflexi bacterium]|nr:ribonuclease HII [Chloroflexota bacterium]